MITIRKAEDKDLDSLVKFQKQLAYETENIHLNEAILKKGIMQIFSDYSKGQYFITEYANKNCGCFLITYEWSDWKCKTYYWLQSVYINPENRKLGIFKHLYNYLKNTVKENDTLAGIKLYVDKSNTNAQNVYRKIGMIDEHYNLFEWIK